MDRPGKVDQRHRHRDAAGFHARPIHTGGFIETFLSLARFVVAFP